MKPSVRRKPSGKGQSKGLVSQKAERKSAASAKPKRKAKTKGRQQPSPTHEARARASGLIDPNVGIVAKDPLRVQILSIATHRQIAPSEFAREAGIALNVASYHFRVLRKHGFLEIVARVKVRGSTKNMHIATKSGFISDADWGQVEQALRPGVAGQILQDFNGRVSQAMETGTLYTRDDACLYWAPGNVDEVAWPELVSVIAWAIEESKRFQVETVERRAKGESHDSFPVTFAIAGFPSPTSAQVKQAKKEGGRKQKPKATRAKGRPKKSKGGEAEVRRQGPKGNGS